jgi:hypothetical protein
MPEECDENGRLDAFYDDSRDTFMTRYDVACPVLALKLA